VVGRWSVDQVLALAPDAAAAAAGRKLAASPSWSDSGVSPTEDAVWSLCLGSGANPYQVMVDLGGPAYTCSCPSRKFPCKHALGLLFRWAAGQVDVEASVPDWVDPWLAGRRANASRAATPRSETPADPEAAAKRSAQRANRVAAGLDELDQWLRDQVRGGLAGADRAGYGLFDAIAARMVDAQAPAVAAQLRGLTATAVSGDAWPSRLLEEFSLLRLLTKAHARLDELPGGLAATVRTRVGYTDSRDDVLASAAVGDHWSVLAMRDSENDQLVTRRAWLAGRDTGRFALVLSFAPAGRALDASLVPGTTINADLHFYDAAVPLRALVGEQRTAPAAGIEVVGGSIELALESYAAALSKDPWLPSWPVVLDAVVPHLQGENWLLTDAAGALPCVSGTDLWVLMAASGGHPVRVFGEITPRGLAVMSLVTAGLSQQLVRR
jgi:hypothetical protein